MGNPPLRTRRRPAPGPPRCIGMIFGNLPVIRSRPRCALGRVGMELTSIRTIPQMKAAPKKRNAWRAGVARAGLALLPALLLAGPAFADDAPKLDSGDTAWMLSSTALVLMMTIPGLALFYAGWSSLAPA